MIASDESFGLQGVRLYSPDNAVYLIVQTDGNLVLCVAFKAWLLPQHPMPMPQWQKSRIYSGLVLMPHCLPPGNPVISFNGTLND